MEIDLTNVGNGHELNEYELSRLKSGHIYQKIKSTMRTINLTGL